MPYIGQYTPAQQRKIVKAKQKGTGLVLRPTVSQQGGFIRSLTGPVRSLTSISIPLVLKALIWQGLQTDPPPRGRGLQVDTPGSYQHPPPFYGTWNQQHGRGKKRLEKAFCSERTVQSNQYH